MIDAALAQQIVESSMDFAIITFDPSGNITSWNPGAERILGWAPEQAIGQHGRIIFTEEDRAAGSPENEMRRALDDGRAVDERLHLRRDGDRFWGSGLMMPLQDGAGFLKIVRDRTKERETERRLTMLTDALPGFVFEADTDGHFARTNARFKTYTGRNDPRLLGNRWLEAIHPKHHDRVRDGWLESVRSGKPFEQTFMVAGHDGHYRSFACRGVPEADDQGRVLRWIGTCIDVEGEAQAKALLEGLNLSLEHAVTDQVAALEATERSLLAEVAERERVEEALRHSQKMEAIGQLTGGLAHDFNNLLTVILGSIDVLGRPDLGEEKRRRYLAAIKETGERAAKLTSQLLAFARRQPLKAENFDVPEHIRQGLDVLKAVCGSRIEIGLQIRCEPCVVHADPAQFQTAVLNMAANARDAMEGKGRLTILVEERNGIPATRGHRAAEGRFISVAVNDTGSGVSSDNLLRVFEPFFTTKEIGKGTGLGLSQVFGFAKQSGGEIVIESSGAGEGATFTLYLPRAEDRMNSGDTQLEPSTAAPPSGSGCVLLVEDNQLVGEFAAQLIGDLGYGNMWVPSAQEALALLEATPDKFDIVFTDVVMPGMSGIELAEMLRDKFPKLPVVLTSGYSHVLAQEGSHGFELLQKPYTAEGLARVLHAVSTR